MEPDPRLEAYLALCKRMYERMRRDGSWPWPEDPPPDPHEDDDQ